MQAPCGIELKAGQVWQRRLNGIPCQVEDLDEGEQLVKLRRFAAFIDAPLELLTNKRGGYQLLRNV